MSSFELRQRQARQFRDVVQLVERSPSAPLYELVTAAVARAPDLTFELLQIAFSDWSQFRLETQPEIDAMITTAMQRRGAA